MADILKRNPAEWIKDPLVRELDENARWRIATNTTLIVTKKGDA